MKTLLLALVPLLTPTLLLADEERPTRSRQPETGLRTAKLQTATGLQSAAQTRISDDDWREQFKRKIAVK